MISKRFDIINSTVTKYYNMKIQKNQAQNSPVIRILVSSELLPHDFDDIIFSYLELCEMCEDLQYFYGLPLVIITFCFGIANLLHLYEIIVSLLKILEVSSKIIQLNIILTSWEIFSLTALTLNVTKVIKKSKKTLKLMNLLILQCPLNQQIKELIANFLRARINSKLEFTAYELVPLNRKLLVVSKKMVKLVDLLLIRYYADQQLKEKLTNLSSFLTIAKIDFTACEMIPLNRTLLAMVITMIEQLTLECFFEGGMIIQFLIFLNIITKHFEAINSSISDVDNTKINTAQVHPSYVINMAVSVPEPEPDRHIIDNDSVNAYVDLYKICDSLKKFYGLPILIDILNLSVKTLSMLYFTIWNSIRYMQEDARETIQMLFQFLNIISHFKVKFTACDMVPLDQTLLVNATIRLRGSKIEDNNPDDDDRLGKTDE
ncbi:hypothetical protein KQX54_007661 [Cotesia glomerata]|uniref:Gustatory receptor n=1 Tax=Cotesia glomerata TaxID=32391 RepID=A0AAV7J3J9_COTGL|nr:hypothetical protein KQX54_007661 [Cotesia glomerata]